MVTARSLAREMVLEAAPNPEKLHAQSLETCKLCSRNFGTPKTLSTPVPAPSRITGKGMAGKFLPSNDAAAAIVVLHGFRASSRVKA